MNVLSIFWWEVFGGDRLGSRKMSREKRNEQRTSDSDSLGRGRGRNVCETILVVDDADDVGGMVMEGGKESE